MTNDLDPRVVRSRLCWKSRGALPLLFTVAGAATATGLGACGAGEELSNQAQAPPRALQEIATDLRALAEGAPLIVVGTVGELRDGRRAGPEGLQFQDVVVSVESVLKGGADITAIILEQPAPSAGVIVSSGGTFKVDGRYLLFVRESRSEAGRHVTVGQGRYLLDGATVRALLPGPVAEQLNGQSVDQVLERVREATQASS